MKKAAIALLALFCAVVASAENVLYLSPVAPNSNADTYVTPGYAFEDKITTSMSLAIWVKDMSAPADREKFIAGVPGLWKLAIPAGANKKLAFWTESGSAEASGYVVNDGQWHFLVGTFNYDASNSANSFQRLYVDGVLVSGLTDGIIEITSTASYAFCLGASVKSKGTSTGVPPYSNWAKDVYGKFAELSVWNRALTAEEVSRLYSQHKRLGGGESGLVAYWPLTGKPSMATADFKFPNAAATTGVPNLTTYYLHYNQCWVAIVEDDDLTLPFVRCVASPEWCTQNSYVQAADATGRSWADPLTNLVDVAASAYLAERILCSPGTHRIETSMSPLVKYLYLGSCDPATGEPCPETAVIDAQGNCRHFFSSLSSLSATSALNFTIENLTFANGCDASGGSMYFQNSIGTIRDCIFRDNIATNGDGGAWYSLGATGMIVSNCLFYGNGASASGGAVFTQHHSEKTTDNCRFYDCVFTNNTAKNGGGVYAARSIILENCQFADNSATNGVGGLLNVGIYSYIDRCIFTGKCKAKYGACMNVYGRDIVVTNCVFRNVECQGSTYGFIHFNTSFASFVDCVITNNANTDSLFFPEAQTNLLVRQCLIADNASNKEVVRDWQSTARFENCTILQQNFDYKNNYGGTNVVVNCIMPNATVSSSGAYCNILSNCCVAAEQGGPFDHNVFTFDPLFMDAEHGDYMLKRYSPCREKGMMLDWMTADSLDFAGLPRVVDALGFPFSAAALPDLGCYEIQDFVRGTILSFK